MWVRFFIFIIMTCAFIPGKIFGQVSLKLNGKKLNTASSATYLNELEKAVVFELNMVRNNPSDYAEFYLKPLREYFDGKLLTYPNQVPVITKEGKKAVEECIRVLNNTQGISILLPNEGLSKAARELVNFQSANGKVGHIGKGKSSPVDRIEKQGTWDVRIAENISYGNLDARQIVIALLVDDGVPSRGHRENILNNDFKLVGVATGKHPGYGTMCVMDFAGGFKSK